MGAQILNIATGIACVLFIASLSGYFSERVGIANIAVDGYMIFGALMFSILSNYINPKNGNNSVDSYSFLLVFLITGLLGIIPGLLFGFGTIKLKGNHIIVGIGVNLLLGGLGFFLTKNLGTISGTARLQTSYSSFGPINESLYYYSTISMMVFVVVVGVISAIYMNKTKYGLRLIATGENPNAVDSQGVSVKKCQWTGVLISSCMGSMAGGIFMMSGIAGHEFEGNVRGYGFLAIAIMIAGNWKIGLFTLIGIAFSLIFASFRGNLIPGLNKNISDSLPFLFTIVIIVLFVKKIQPPAHVGIPFDPNKR